jgi:Zn-finger nucleic acid-binding protein
MKGPVRQALCPECAAAFRTITLEGHYDRAVVIDACERCGGLWFDGQELLQLTPGAVLALLKTLDSKDRKPQPRLQPLDCPRCAARLAVTHDRQRETRFHYDRCPAGCGRFMTFFQFLRSRNFVRELTASELVELREHIQSVNCSNCGAPVDVARSAICGYCHTPISTVEPGQIRTAIEEMQEAAAKRGVVDPALPLNLAVAQVESMRALAPPARHEPWAIHGLLGNIGNRGLVEAGIAALIRTLS